MSQSKTVKNAAWIIACKIVQALVGLVVAMLSARYLGPSNYGVLNYAISVVAFVEPIMQLGLNSTLVQEFVDYPDREGETIGTAFFLNFISALVSIGIVIAFTAVANAGEKVTIIVCLLYGIKLIFQAFEMLQYWFQAKLLSKYASITALCAYAVVSVYKIFLLISGKNVFWFAVSQSIDFAVIAVVQYIIYRRIGGQKLRITLRRAGELLSKGKYYIVSAMMVTIFAQTDKIMLKLMLGNDITGYYSAAAFCAGIICFVFVAIIDSARPTILERKKLRDGSYEDGMITLYSVITCLSLAQSMVFTAFARLIVNVLCGAAYAPAVPVLRLIVWYTTFSYLGAVRVIWILAEEKHSVLWIINLSGAVLNVILNVLLIPVWGMLGAAFASLVTQIFTNFIIGFIVMDIRPNNKLILAGMNPKHTIKLVKQIIINKTAGEQN